MQYSQTSIILNLNYLDGDSTLIRTACVKIQTSCCSILLLLVLLPGAMHGFYQA